MKKKVIAFLLILAMTISLAGCKERKDTTPQEEKIEKNGEIYILFTSDVHCGINDGFGYAGLKQVMDTLEAQGYEIILVDNGDSIQGDLVGYLSKGDTVIELMNEVGYDIAVPGNHEFDYGMDVFLDLTKKADFPYISCNFNYKGDLVFEPYVIKEVAGIKIAFVGITTPSTITSSTPKYFMDESGEFVYGFLQGETWDRLYEAVQNAVDEARGEGAELVYALGHVGMVDGNTDLTYADIVENTNGIDVFLDGHSHDTELVVMKNKDGLDVVRAGCGTKLRGIGYSLINAEKKVIDTGVWNWTNSINVSGLLGVHNEISERVDAVLSEIHETVSKKVAHTDFEITINDPAAVDDSGNQIRMIRRAETNMGDLCADALRIVTGADVAFLGGGSLRGNFVVGDITSEKIMEVQPFGNTICLIRATGQQIIDTLEWSVHSVPSEFGGFLQVSGISFDVDVSVPSGCKTDESGFLTGIEGARRIKNVMINGVPIDPDSYYIVAGGSYTLLDNGDGYTTFNNAELITESAGVDYEILHRYLTENLSGEIGPEYADPYGEGRINIINSGI